jgi:hypothetical protein
LPADDAVPVGLQAHLGRFGAPPYRGGPRRLIGDAEAAGLTGRGGAAFPTYRKLAAVAGYGPGPVVVGNGAEGEPASSKDKYLLWFSPHLVLDGLQLAAEAVGSATAGLYVHRSPRLRQRLAAAIAERAAAGVDAAQVELIEAPPRFLAGEESALASRASGGPALPRFKPPRASQRGVAGRPTLVQNVETLAHLALIARYGAAWFRSAGTPAEPGSMLATLHHPDGRMSVVETTLGTPIAGLLPLPAQAMLVGGYHGAWLPAAQAELLPLANAALRPLGAAVGAGVLAALPGDRCGLAETARVVRYLALESVLANLMSNAGSHTPPGTTVAVTLAAPGPGASSVVLSVTDDGPGIPADLQPGLFGRFIRGDSSRSHTTGSAGLGLAIVDAVTAAHGGSVAVTSRPGRTTFAITLPRLAGPLSAGPEQPVQPGQHGPAPDGAAVRPA